MYKFHGWDWTELAAAYGISDAEEFLTHEQENELIEQLKQYMWDRYETEHEQVMIDTLRQFIQALHDAEPGYDKPIWEGLLRVEDNNTLIKYTCALLPYMWT